MGGDYKGYHYKGYRLLCSVRQADSPLAQA